MEGDRSISTPSDGLGDGFQKIRALHGRTSGPTRRSTKGQWTPEEDEVLRRAVQRFKGKNWKKIAECFKDRTDVQCLHRWQKVLNPELVKGPWSKEEDEIIIELVNKYGPKKWSTISQHLPGRIGKQCRERWHNHLNPAINKEAWTQEEELALIRAHQIYGNKWAELTKFLPGRTDNSIKNHWNSSVKKKLDSYLKSGLLAQFQGLPHVGHQNQPMVSSSSRMQSSGDDSGHKGTEAEEISECSQDSTFSGRFPSSNDMASVVLCTRKEFQGTNNSGLGKDPNPSSASCSVPYYPSVEGSAFSVPEISPEIGSAAKFLEQGFPHDAETSISGDIQFNLDELPNISSLELACERSGIPTHCLGSDVRQGENVQFQTSEGLSVSTSMGTMPLSSNKPAHMLISDDECCTVLFSEAMNNRCFSSKTLAKGSDFVGLGGCTGSLLSHSSNIPMSEASGTAATQLYCPSNSNATGTSCSQTFHPTVISANDRPLIFGGESNHLFGTQEYEYIISSDDGFVFANDCANSPCNDGTDAIGLHEQSDTLKDSSKLVPVNTFSSRSDTQTCPMDRRPDELREQKDTGALCYEPPRFPSLDVPFFSCDLVQSGSDMQQEYSPLGIRQLMMSSMNCLTPFRLWDSPTRDNSPDAVLKSAAKTFTGTPTILKKRHRELFSPLSDRRCDKKLDTHVTSSLMRDFSRLDVMFDDSGSHKAPSVSPSCCQDGNTRNSAASAADKENQGHLTPERLKKGSDSTEISDGRIPEKDVEDSESQEKTKHGVVDVDAKTKIDAGPTSEIEEMPSEILVEHNINDLLLYSPDQVNLKAERALGSGMKTPRNQYHKSSEPTSNQCVGQTSAERQCASVCSPSISGKKLVSCSVAETCVQSDSSLILPEMMGCNAGSDATTETISMFGSTPFKRSIESPSAWKSPWFINSFLPCPRIDTEITIEDFGYFMSPGNRSYDAIGLMKQVSEQTAAAYANAQEILGDETPETLFQRRTSHERREQENNHVRPNQLQSHSHLPQNILTERRTLDFSECGTPGKGIEHGKSSTSVSFSSPSSYLLKGCR
ncbi:hypothetical protein FEM48_Zijuj06G0094700 [Ziziphus jujuba var. spinosa]|uniref:Transcription factor MYB3R-1-like n=1 Tax=Ziziphus jujuba var. spinosa TaxID=714518 RepID=A0A978V8H2_ZIZJJ|nr:hypothetical protein FEM48_Zijuj06G0094700 [Ziziphus jujuba var. spinosa]